jgi:hypothetical protein
VATSAAFASYHWYALLDSDMRVVVAASRQRNLRNGTTRWFNLLDTSARYAPKVEIQRSTKKVKLDALLGKAGRLTYVGKPFRLALSLYKRAFISFTQVFAITT